MRRGESEVGYLAWICSARVGEQGKGLTLRQSSAFGLAVAFHEYDRCALGSFSLLKPGLPRFREPARNKIRLGEDENDLLMRSETLDVGFERGRVVDEGKADVCEGVRIRAARREKTDRLG